MPTLSAKTQRALLRTSLRTSLRTALRTALRAAAALLLPLLAQHISAHTSNDTDNAPAEAPTLQVGASIVLRSLSAPEKLPSQALGGYLRQGDPGTDPRSNGLEHGVLEAAYRFDNTWSAQFVAGAHASDPAHIETLWLQARSTFADSDWTLGMGRQSPTLGPVINHAGHMDRFGLMPLAKQASTDGDWIEDGTELGIQDRWQGLTWRFNAGLWAGQQFPGSSASPAFPSLHAGVQWSGNSGQWALDGFTAQLEPTARGSRITSSNGAHSHAAPVCDASLSGVVCFNGQSQLSGISGQWVGRELPLTFQGALLWRNEQGTLESQNGLVQYEGRNQGDWLEAIWRIRPDWETALRHERLSAAQQLTGSGATLLAAEAGFGSYSPQERSTWMLRYATNPWSWLHLEAGQERSNNPSVSWLALRWMAHWKHLFW